MNHRMIGVPLPQLIAYYEDNRIRKTVLYGVTMRYATL